MTNGPAIYVDADACPVKDEVLRVAVRHKLMIFFVANSGARPTRDPMIRYITVTQGADAADDWIVANLRANDIVVTADIPLASRALAAGARAIGPNGKAFTEGTIGMALAMRDLKQRLRESGADRGFNAPYTAKDRTAFLQVMDETVTRALREVK